MVSAGSRVGQLGWFVQTKVQTKSCVKYISNYTSQRYFFDLLFIFFLLLYLGPALVTALRRRMWTRLLVCTLLNTSPLLLLCTTGWLVGLVSRVAEDRKRVVCPVIDIISDETFAYVRSFEMHWGAFNWDLHFRWYTRAAPYERRRDVTEAFRTPAMAGGLFAMDKQYFFELGGYDEKMEVWGGENLELSFRVCTHWS